MNYLHLILSIIKRFVVKLFGTNVDDIDSKYLDYILEFNVPYFMSAYESYYLASKHGWTKHYEDCAYKDFKYSYIFSSKIHGADLVRFIDLEINRFNGKENYIYWLYSWLEICIESGKTKSELLSAMSSSKLSKKEVNILNEHIDQFIVKEVLK